MGGMFTILKVRAEGDTSEWYREKAALQARIATEKELINDEIEL